MSVHYLEAQIARGASARGALANLADVADAPLGGVAGVTDDGRLVALLDVPSAAQKHLTEDSPWWAELRAAVDADDARVEPAAEVGVFVSAIPTQSGFAQVMRARVTDRPAFERLLAADAEWLARERPEIVGGALAWHGRDRFTLVVCFSDEGAARAGEAKNAESPGADIDQLMQDVSYDELRDPWTLPL